MTILKVLTFLFTRYRTVDLRRVTIKEKKVTDFSWNIIDPPVCIFNLVEDLESIAEAAQVPKTANELISYGLDIICNRNRSHHLDGTLTNRTHLGNFQNSFH